MKKHLLSSLLVILFSISIKAQLNFEWAKAIGGSGNDFANAVAVDDSGYVYVTGLFGPGTINFNPYGTSAVNQIAYGTTCFFAKYTPTGNCIWAKRLGASNLAFAAGLGIKVSHSGDRVYVCGVFLGQVDFSPPNHDTITSYGSTVDAFVTEYNGIDGSINWAHSIGGAGDNDLGLSVSIDETQNMVYLAGSFEQSTDFDPQGSGHIIQSNGSTDGYIAAFNTLSGNFSWVKQIGGSGSDVVNSSVVDNSGNICVAGAFSDSVNFNANVGTDTLISMGSTDIFFAKYNSGSNCLWAKPVGSYGVSSPDGATSLTVDVSDNIFITGYFSGAADFDPDTAQAATDKKTAVGVSDVFFAKYDNNGNHTWAKTISGTNQADSIGSSCIAVNTEGKVFLTGFVKGAADFNPSNSNVLTGTTPNFKDLFVAKYENDGSFAWAKVAGGANDDSGNGLAVDTVGNCVFVGGFSDTVNFDFNQGIAKRGSHGILDIFIVKYGYGNSTVSGKLLYNGSLYGNFNKVILYTQVPNDGNLALHIVDSTSQIAQVTGVYNFYNVLPGDYVILGIPDTTYYSDSVAPTYYGDTVAWGGAQHITVIPNVDNNNIDIHLKSCSNLNGTATLSGFIIEGEGFDRTAGTPVQGTGVGLDHDPGGNLVSSTMTNESGYYEFKHVLPGQYTIYVNIPGLPMNTYHVNVTASDTISHLDFVADSNSIDTVAIVTNVINRLPLNSNILKAFPNPYKGTVSIEFNVSSPCDVLLEIRNVLGSKVKTLMSEYKQPGMVKCQYSADGDLPPGIYFLNLKLGNTTFIKKIIQTE